ncbi:GNA1162 family protein [Campylobacter sp. 19-13652]|uniref:GNA1162 family protein n=1 Tax=Campylobacter sp. 19-13652 TaxID=2840180 RepID=UPI001C763691|nr:GNA1162 family protein [Campylobacter sp. 19-13652]BCX78929.1 hypothetical protein LBC_03910 [Campylobacter sp. 19-13652]
MRRFGYFLIVAFGLILAGCGSSTYFSTPADRYPNLKNYAPNTILVLPPVNKTSAADAPLYAMAAFSEPFIQQGYYLIPPSLSTAFFASENLSDPAQIATIAPEKLGDIFGADIIVYPVIWAWDTDYSVLSSRVGVGLSLKLVHAKMGHILYQDSGYYAKENAKSNNGGLLDLVANAITAAINTASDYFPIAQNATNQIILSKPVGKYHPDYTTQWSTKGEFISLFSLEGDKLYTQQEYAPYYDGAKPFFLNDGKRVYIIDELKKDGKRYYYPVLSVVDLGR